MYENWLHEAHRDDLRDAFEEAVDRGDLDLDDGHAERLGSAGGWGTPRATAPAWRPGDPF